MIRTCQGKTHLSLDLTEGFPEACQSMGRRWLGLAVLDPVAIGPTPQRNQRDQTSICGNSIEPSTKIEFE